jgi:protoporphyrinogen oxidase
VECTRIFADYAVAQSKQILSRHEAAKFEEWVTQRFGARLYERFFKTYTEKVWGIDCTRGLSVAVPPRLP